MNYPALDLAGYRLRSEVPSSYVDTVELLVPGFVLQKAKTLTSRIYAQLRKRYGLTLPFGQAPIFDAVGTSPPPITLSGIPTSGSLELVIGITTAGPVGTAVFQWSTNSGQTWTTGVVTAPTVALAGTGLIANFPASTYSTDNVFTAPTPVPETILGWLVALLDVAVLRKHGANSQDPGTQDFVALAKTALDEIAQAANSKDGLFDLPPVDGEQPSNVSTGGVISYSEAGSPYVSGDRQEFDGHCEDERGFGTFSGVSSTFGSLWP